MVHDRRVVRSVFRTCMKSRRFSAKKHVQQESTLPSERVACSRPFMSVGTDFGGPLITADGNKTYFLIITIFTTRAIHLELVQNMEDCDVNTGPTSILREKGKPAVHLQ